MDLKLFYFHVTIFCHHHGVVNVAAIEIFFWYNHGLVDVVSRRSERNAKINTKKIAMITA